MGQSERFEIAFAQRQREPHALVGGEGEDCFAVFRTEEIGHAPHRVQL